MKEKFNQTEMEALGKSHHGGLKFQVYLNDTVVVSCYRVTIGGGLDYCNNQVDKLASDPNHGVFKVVISDRIGRRKWKSIAFLERTKESQFNH